MIEKLTEIEQGMVQTFSFRTSAGVPGTVTGILIDLTVGGPRVIRMVSAGCKHGFYTIPPTSKIEKVEKD